MELMLKRLFQQHVVEQLKIMVAQNALLLAHPSDHDVVWPALQAFLEAGANVSRLLWGQSGIHTADRKDLRRSVGVKGPSVLEPTRMADHGDHFDERLDEWWNASVNHNFADRNIGPFGSIGGLAEVEKFRLYDPATRRLWFWGDEYDLNQHMAEVNRILPIAEVEAAKPY